MKNLKFKSMLLTLSEFSQIGLGIFLASIGLKAFLIPNGFLDGGVTGLAILLNTQFGLNTSLMLVLLSIPFLLLAMVTLSYKMVAKSVMSILILATVIHYETFAIVTEDKLLISIFGGLFVGLGIGLAIRNGAVLDGSEVLGIFLNDRFAIDIGKVILSFNIILFGFAATLISLETAMYSILTYMVTAKVIDFVIKGFEDFIGITIVSNESESVKHALLEKLGAGLTVYKGSEGHGHNGIVKDQEIIHTIINRIELGKVYRILNEIDPEAFVIEFDVNNIKGGMMRRFLVPKKTTSKKEIIKKAWRSKIKPKLTREAKMRHGIPLNI